MTELGTIILPQHSYRIVQVENTHFIHIYGLRRGIPLPGGSPDDNEKRFFDLYEQQLQKLETEIARDGFPIKGIEYGITQNNASKWEVPEDFGGGSIGFTVYEGNLKGAFQRPRNQRELPIEEC